MSKLDIGEMLHVADLVAESSYEFEEEASVGVVSVVSILETAAQPAEETPEEIALAGI